MVEKLGIGDMVIDTGFVSDKERDCLYENCKMFLFPSVFAIPPSFMSATNFDKCTFCIFVQDIDENIE